ncbi:MAG: glycosyltransferase [Spirochaetia bacterium]|nr:glycosyltransferase [Spirochaetia bacterium]
MKKFLLIAFKFPPYAGVGGFRWSKLCKYLAQMGHEIHVVTVRWKKMGPNTFIEDVNHPNIKIHQIESLYPHNIKYKSFNNKYLNKIKIILWYLLNKFILSIFYFDDEAQRWGRTLIAYCEKLLKEENIKVVISTGHPFQANRWAAVLKEKNPEIKLIQDFRDPWYEDPEVNKIKKIEEWQRFSIAQADKVVAVTKGLLDLFLKKESKSKGYVIDNGYDKNDFYENLLKKRNQKLYDFIYLGNVACGRSELLLKFIKSIREIKDKIKIKKILIISSYVPNFIQTEIEDLVQTGLIELKPIMSQEKAFEYLVLSKYGLQLNAKVYPYLVSTKIYEYAMMKVPCVSLNYGGDIEDYFKKYDIGYSINVEKADLKKELIKLYKKPEKKFKFNISKFYYKNLAKEYSKLING